PSGGEGRVSQSSAQFEYKVAPVGKRLLISIDEQSARHEDAKSGRNSKTVYFLEIDSARWVETQLFTYGQLSMRSSELILKHKDGAWRIRLGDGNPSRKDATNRKAYFAACAALLANAAKVKPDLEVTVGSGSALRWIMSAFGALSLIIGLYVAFGSLGSFLAGQWIDGLFFLALSLAFAGSGAGMAISFNPFAPRERMPAADLALFLANREAAK
ncbi:MAG: hypothetical protein KDA48_14980, partial [Amphiplicatus sp.]|nr:hypothetical protein [Amphiplicatus sp.]